MSLGQCPIVHDGKKCHACALVQMLLAMLAIGTYMLVLSKSHWLFILQ